MEKVGRYLIHHELGRGGMSSVYLAHDPRFERQVALKLLPREFLHVPGFLARFEREAKSIAALEHPAIVPVYDFGEQDGQPYLVMRYMPEGSLKDRLQRGHMTLDKVVAVVERVAAALDEAHARGIIHRDVKPDNILFDKLGDAYLSDFGIVKLAEQTATFSGSGILGTPAYMSPEQARGDADLDGRSDVYALGCVVYELMSGGPPYAADTPMGLAVKHITEPVPRLRQVNPSIAGRVEEVVSRAMAKDREDRYATASEFGEGLAHARAGRAAPESTPPVEPEPERSGEPATPRLAPGAEGLSKTLQVSERPWYMHRWVWLVAALIGMGGLLGLGSFISSAGRSVPRPAPTPLPTEPEAMLPSTEPAVSPSPAFAAVEGPAPSDKVAAFYYPWYGTPQIDGEWVHWSAQDYAPPEDIASDYYPLLGPYSSNAPELVAQHFAWLRATGVGVVISSWWGRGSYEDHGVPLLLEMADRYGLRVAFHIEPYTGRSAVGLLADVRYLYEQYGDHPAFLRTTASTRWSQGEGSKGVFFLWAPAIQDASEQRRIEAEYWAEAVDEIHNLPQGGLVIASMRQPEWVDRGHFDGLYNYATLNLEESAGFRWAAGLPPGAWYVPSVVPGFSARRIGYPQESYLAREGGASYDAQWTASLEVGVEPAIMTVTSFNEWHEGSQIEPALAGAENGRGYRYEDYGQLGEDGYLMLTRQWVDRFLAMEWPGGVPIRVRLMSTSDWTEFGLVEGARWIRPEFVSSSKEADRARMQDGWLALNQPLERSNAGGQVELVVDLIFLDLAPGGNVTFSVQRGSQGRTQAELYVMDGGAPTLVRTIRWGGVIEGNPMNPLQVEVPADELLAGGL